MNYLNKKTNRIMQITLQCGDKIAIPTGCKATVSDGFVLFEAEKPEFKRGDFVWIGNSMNHIVIVGGEDKFEVLLMNSGGINPNPFFSGFYAGSRHATPEERNQLLEAMHEAGTDWDFEKQEVVDWVWRPKIGDNYFIIDPEDGSGVMELSYENDSIDNINFKIGIAFKTRELAEEALFMLKQCKHY